MRWHTMSGRVKSELQFSSDTNTLMYRTEISRHLLDEAANKYPDNITFDYHKKLVDVDFDAQVATFENQLDGTTVQVLPHRGDESTVIGPIKTPDVPARIAASMLLQHPGTWFAATCGTVCVSPTSACACHILKLSHHKAAEPS